MRENEGNSENLPKTQGILPKHREFPDSKDQGYCAICRRILSKELNVSAKSVLHTLKLPQITEIDIGKICGRTWKT